MTFVERRLRGKLKLILRLQPHVPRITRKLNLHRNKRYTSYQLTRAPAGFSYLEVVWDSSVWVLPRGLKPKSICYKPLKMEIYWNVNHTIPVRPPNRSTFHWWDSRPECSPYACNSRMLVWETVPLWPRRRGGQTEERPTRSLCSTGGWLKGPQPPQSWLGPFWECP